MARHDHRRPRSSRHQELATTDNGSRHLACADQQENASPTSSRQPRRDRQAVQAKSRRRTRNSSASSSSKSRRTPPEERRPNVHVSQLQRRLHATRNHEARQVMCKTVVQSQSNPHDLDDPLSPRSMRPFFAFSLAKKRNAQRCSYQ